MSTVGTLVRFPGIIPLSVPVAGSPPVIPAANLILRGHLVGMTGGFAVILAAAIVPGTGSLCGIALSDADPDTAYVSVATGRGVATVSVKPVAGQTFTAGTPVFQAATPNFGLVATVGVGPLGYAVSGQPDALGNIEMAFYANS